MQQKHSPEQLLETAYEIFLQQAADHLPPEDIIDITLEFEERGAVESTRPAGDWIREVGGPFDTESWAEVWIGLLDHQDEFKVLYAKLLLPWDPSHHDVHIRWKPAL